MHSTKNIKLCTNFVIRKSSRRGLGILRAVEPWGWGRWGRKKPNNFNILFNGYVQHTIPHHVIKQAASPVDDQK